TVQIVDARPRDAGCSLPDALALIEPGKLGRAALVAEAAVVVLHHVRVVGEAIVPVLITDFGVPVVAIGVGQHLGPLAREVELGFVAKALALFGARRRGLLPRR